MKLITFNVNGVRAAIKKGLLEWLDEEQPDVLCLQEIKLFETHLVEHYFTERGYHCYWHPAQKRGYSGVATLSKTEPASVQYGMGIESYDFEGRVLVTEISGITLVNTYFPSGSSAEARQHYKFKFLDDYFVFIDQLKAAGKQVMICGDVNICHQEIDIHNPKRNQLTSGFLIEERYWVTKLLNNGFVDTFRFLNADPHQYTWWTYRAGAREKNLGWRIDYFFMCESLANKLTNATIHNNIYMSDHCPVSITLSR